MFVCVCFCKKVDCEKEKCVSACVLQLTIGYYFDAICNQIVKQFHFLILIFFEKKIDKLVEQSTCIGNYPLLKSKLLPQVPTGWRTTQNVLNHRKITILVY